MAACGTTPIAIIGIGCRFPGNVTNPERLWALLAEGHSCWMEVPADRFNDSSFYNPNPDGSGTHDHHGGHFLTQDIATFDADFFHISPTEAEAMDPQQRILLETTYEAFESCGYSLDSVRGSNTAVFVAMFSRDYDRNIYKDTDDIPKYQTTGTGDAILANRISYIFDLKGPSITLDTGCSGSLVALHQACQSLRMREADTAIAGGVNLILSPDSMIGMTNLHMLSKDGKSYSFDSRGSGYGRGEGSATIVVKRLEDAIRCGDPIRAVISNTAVSQDGKTSGITFPSSDAQRNLQQSIYQDAGIDPGTVGYVEAHGTGTVAGDLAEIRAIGDVFCPLRVTPLHVGSIKSNIGHLESASGLAGLVKAVLILEKGFIPPNANMETARPELELNTYKIIIPKELQPFGDYPIRRVSVNSFGFGGTNAHVILEQAPDPEVCIPNQKPKPGSNMDDPRAFLTSEKTLPQLLVFSTKSRESLVTTARNLKEWISMRRNTIDVEDLAYTLSLGRTIFPWRFTLIAKNYQDIVDATKALETNQSLRKMSPEVRITFIFTGQGAQWYAMGRELILMCPLFKESLAKSESILLALGASWSLIDELLLGEFETRVNQSSYAQPACTAIQIALVQLIDSIGVQPNTVLGHSSGEIAAAYAAGILSHAAAMKVAYYRGFAPNQQSQHFSFKGAMLAVGLSEEETSLQIDKCGYNEIYVACVNSPIQTTVSGSQAIILELHEVLRSSSIFSRILNVDKAYHSFYMEDTSTQYLDCLQGLEVREKRDSVKFISTVSGMEKHSNFGPKYWVDNLVSKVRFSDAMVRHCHLERHQSGLSSDQGKQIMIEIGPHAALEAPVRQTLQQNNRSFEYDYFPTLRRGNSALLTFLRLAGRLFELGAPLNLQKIHSIMAIKSRHAVIHDLPSYPWDHSHQYWYESRISKQHRFREHAPHDLLGTRIVSSTSLMPQWRHLVGIENLPWLQEHVVDGLVVFPGSAYMCMVIEAARQVFVKPAFPEIQEIQLEKIYFSRALVIPPAPAKVEIHLSLVKPLITDEIGASVSHEFRISALSQEGFWNEHCGGLLKVNHLRSGAHGPETYTWSRLGHILENNLIEFPDGMMKLNTHDLYRNLESNGNCYGPCFANIKEAYSYNMSQLTAKVSIPDVARVMPAQYLRPHVIHPTTLDALMHSTVPLYTSQNDPGSVMPIGIEHFRISVDLQSTPNEYFHTETILSPDRPETARADILVFDPHSLVKPVIEILGVKLRGFPRKHKNSSNLSQPCDSGFRVRLDIDADFLLPSDFTSLELATAVSPAVKLEMLNRAASIYIIRNLSELKAPHLEVSKPHLLRLLEWMECHQVPVEKSFPLDNVKCLSDTFLLDQLQHLGTEGQMLCRVGHALTSILTGKTEPLALMLEDDLLYKFYGDDSSARCYAHLSQYLKYLCFKKPRLRVIEIGAGTGATTLPTLRALSAGGTVQMDQYDFTDVSAGFFDKARLLLAEWAPFVTFKPLDISCDPQEQGFQNNSYDLAIAANVLHATSSIEETLSNVRRLLKPQGKLLLIELTRLQPFLGLIFGTLPGWWRSVSDKSDDSPILTKDQWHDALSKTAFSGLNLAIDDTTGPAQTSTFMVSTATTVDYHVLRRPIRIIVEDCRSNFSLFFARAIESEFQLRGLDVSLVSWEADHLKPNVINMIIEDSASPLLLKPSSATFDRIINLVAHGEHIFWISAPASIMCSTNPGAGLVTGLARSAHAENPRLRMVTLDIQQPLDRDMSILPSILYNLVLKSFNPFLDDVHSREREYIYRDGKILVPRVVPYDNLNRWISQCSGNPSSSLDFCCESKNSTKPVHTTATIDSSFKGGDVPSSQLEAFDVELDVKACGIGPGDRLFGHNQTEAHPLIAECAGTITSTGSKVADLEIGRKVIAFAGKLYSSKVHVNRRNVVQLPESMTFTIGASIPVAFTTAYHCLISLAGLKKDQSIMIYAATGAVEQAAILIAKHIGATILAIVSSISERALLIEKLDMSPAQVMLTDTGPASEDVSHMTGKNGVDFILSCSTNTLTERDLACSAFGGTVLQAVNSRSPRLLLREVPLEKNLTFKIVDMMALMDQQPSEVSSLLTKIMTLFEHGLLKASHSITVKMTAKIEETLKGLQYEDRIGRIVLECDHGSEMMTEEIQPAPLSLVGNATYVIAGGLGDIGPRIIMLMVMRGARHIVLLSRRRLEVDRHRRIQEKMKLVSPDSRLYWKTCDIADHRQVIDCADSLVSRGVPPVKGVIQAATVLRVSCEGVHVIFSVIDKFKDRSLPNLTLEDFNIPLQAKVHGTRNLYSAFQNLSLDFFIMLSSVTGMVGTGGQANYVVGNTFQDAFSTTRSAQMFPCISVDIGWIEDANINNSIREQNLARHGLMSITFNKLLALLEYAMSYEVGQNQCRHIGIGLNGQSISRVDIPNATAKSPLFSHIQQAPDAGDTQPSPWTARSLKLAILESSDIEQVHQHVTAAITRKISSLVASEGLHRKADHSMSELGLDSLITTELKNWISAEFEAATQVSEILDQASIRSFAMLVASRATFVQEKIKRLSCEHEDIYEPRSSANDESRTLLRGTVPSSHIMPPSLPLPDLNNTLSMYLESIRVFLSEDEISHTLEITAEFLRDDGIGQELQGRLRARAQDPEIDSWLSDPYCKKIYLERRDPIHPTGTFYGGHILMDIPHTQAERAAILAVAAFKFKCLLELGTVDQDYINDEPLCMESLHWLFNATREPVVGIDRMRRSQGHDHLIALRNGHIYKIPLRDLSGEIAYWRVKAAFEHVLATSENHQPALATLTADERDSWARIRENALTTSDVNRSVLDNIESAIFVVCLDDGEPNTASERCNQFFLGNPSNRWSDKTLQFVVCRNGVSAFIGEHAMLDGMSVRQFNKFITRAIMDHNKFDSETTLDGESLAEELTFISSPALESHIYHIQQQFSQKYTPIELVHHRIHTLGHTFFRTHKCPAKAGCQVIIQLACLLYYGYQPASWETISMSRFRHGRVDWIQAVLPPMASFCAAACDNTLPILQQRELFFHAINAFANTATQIMRGYGFKAHMHALWGMVRDDEPTPALFTDQAWQATSVASIKTVKTDCLEGAMLQETAFLMPEPWCVFVHYEVEDDGCLFFVQTWLGRTSAFCDALERAAETVKNILQLGD